MGITAENLAADFSISREESDTFAVQSQERWAAAKAAGKFDRSRLEAAKNSEDYNVGKRQILTAFNTGDPDKATLIALRGADSPIASAPGMPPGESRCERLQRLTAGCDSHSFAVLCFQCC